jgi:hypothetical protein
MSDLKATLSDKVISRLPLSDKGQYEVRDTELRGFFVRVGTKTKAFAVLGEHWKDGKRHAKKVTLGTTDDLTTRDARAKAKDVLAKIAKGEYAEEAKKAPDAPPTADVTLGAGLGAVSRIAPRTEGPQRGNDRGLRRSRRTDAEGLARQAAKRTRREPGLGLTTPR